MDTSTKQASPDAALRAFEAGDVIEIRALNVGLTTDRTGVTNAIGVEPTASNPPKTGADCR